MINIPTTTVGMLRLAWSGGPGGALSLSASPLGNTACLLLLALLHHASQAPQPLQATLSTLCDADDVVGDGDAEAGWGDLPRVSFSGLYDALCVTCMETPVTMLIYSLVRLSEAFREYVLVRGVFYVNSVFSKTQQLWVCLVCCQHGVYQSQPPTNQQTNTKKYREKSHPLFKSKSLLH